MKKAIVTLKSYDKNKEEKIEFVCPLGYENVVGKREYEIQITTDGKMTRISSYCQRFNRKRNGKLEFCYTPEWEVLGVIPSKTIKYIICE